MFELHTTSFEFLVHSYCQRIYHHAHVSGRAIAGQGRETGHSVRLSRSAIRGAGMCVRYTGHACGLPFPGRWRSRRCAANLRSRQLAMRSCVLPWILSSSSMGSLQCGAGGAGDMSRALLHVVRAATPVALKDCMRSQMSGTCQLRCLCVLPPRRQSNWPLLMQAHAPRRLARDIRRLSHTRSRRHKKEEHRCMKPADSVVVSYHAYERAAWTRREGRRKLAYLACPPGMPDLSDTFVPYHSALSALILPLPHVNHPSILLSLQFRTPILNRISLYLAPT